MILILSTALLSAALLSACTQADVKPKHVGYVEADWVYISAPESGWITSRPVSEGQMLNIGDIVFELDKEQQQAGIDEASSKVAQADAQSRDLTVGARPAEIRSLEAKLTEAQAQLTQTKSERDRILPLAARGIETKNRGEQVVADYEMAKARVQAASEAIAVARLSGRKAAKDAAIAARKTAQAAKLSAEIKLDRRTIISKTSGRIEEIFHYQGEYVTQGAPIIALLPENSLKVRFFVTQAELPKLETGKTVDVTADGHEGVIKAKITYISSTAEFTPPVIYSADSRGKLVFLIEAVLPSGAHLHPGLPVDVDFS